MKVHVLTKCETCNGESYMPAGKGPGYKGEDVYRYLPCPCCRGTGEAGKWVELSDFLLLLDKAKCSHEHVSRSGGFHYSGGEIWDDIKDVCDDCGETLK